MANQSQYKKLTLPLTTELYDVNVFNNNAKIIDEELHRLDEKNQSQDNLLATKAELNTHVDNKSNPHGVTKSQVGLGNVENKSSATIRNEITKANVIKALGYTPDTPNDINNKLSSLIVYSDSEPSSATNGTFWIGIK